jgi:hydroxyethylthiazole kinase-like uncharacterized protein yjeF
MLKIEKSHMDKFNPDLLRQLYLPPPNSHKGQNGKLMVIGGSHLFHAASLWALTMASRIVDMVFYSSVPENNEIVQNTKKEFGDGIVVLREDIGSYIEEADAVLIGPGMLRTEELKHNNQELELVEINKLEDEGAQSYYLTKYLLNTYPEKKWVIDAGALQMMDLSWLQQLKQPAILTPHQGEFERVFGVKGDLQQVSKMAKQHNAVILLKGEKDIVCSAESCLEISGGNAGMTKGGTGDVLAGLVGGLATKNAPFLSAAAGAYFNKKAGEELFKRVGFFFNASDLASEIPVVMKNALTPTE